MCIRDSFVIVLAAVSSTLAFQGRNGIGGERGSANTEYAIGLWGDVPYSDVQANVGVPNMIDDMNSQKLAFTVNDGDLKQGSGNCDDALYNRSLNYLNALEAPAIFTPGDNDWTDCDRNAGVSSLERLSHERQLFFSTVRLVSGKFHWKFSPHRFAGDSDRVESSFWNDASRIVDGPMGVSPTRH